MENIKIMKGDIKNLIKPIETIIMKTSATNVVFDKSRHVGSRYVISIPNIDINEDNALEYLEKYIKVALEKARAFQKYELAIECVAFEDDDLTFSFAAELKDVLEKYLKLSNKSEEITIICPTKEIVDIYELAIYGEVRSAQVTMVDRLEGNDVIVVATNKKMRKFHKSYKRLRKYESKVTFWGILFERLDHGKYYLTNGDAFSEMYYFINLTKEKKQKIEDFTDAACEAITNILNSAATSKQKMITVPVVRISKRRDENKMFVKAFVNAVYKTADEHEMRIKFYCTDPEIWGIVENCFDEMGEVD